MHNVSYVYSQLASQTPPPPTPLHTGDPPTQKSEPRIETNQHFQHYDFSKNNFCSIHGTVNNFCSERCNKSTTQLILHQRYSHSFTPSTRLPGKFSPCFATILRRRENLCFDPQLVYPLFLLVAQRFETRGRGKRV